MAKAKAKSNTTITQDNAVVRYFKETKAELSRVAWPTRDETKNLTLIVVVVTVAMAAFLGMLDYLFQIVVSNVISGEIFGIVTAIILFVFGAAAFYYNSLEE